MSDVIDITKKKQEKADEEAAKSEGKSKSEQATEQDFAAIAAANEAKKKKLERERLQANKGVLRTYRIKN